MTTAATAPRPVDADHTPDPDPAVEPGQTPAAPAPAPDSTPAGEEDAGYTVGGYTIPQLREQLAASPSGKIVLDVHPDEVTIGYNVRKKVTVNAKTVKSVTEHGFVQEPPAFINEDGRVEMLAGQRRILAARKAKRDKVSIVLRSLTAKDADALRAAKIEAGLTENLTREGMEGEDVIATVEDYLALPGITPTKAGRKLGLDTPEVKSIQAISKSPHARKIAADGQLGFEQAEAAMEFENDPDAEQRLFAAAERGTFTAELAKLREEREFTAAHAEAAESYTKRGFAILDEKPERWDYYVTSPLEKLYRADGTAATLADITDPTQWAVYLEETETEDTNGGGLDRSFEPAYYCRAAKAAGLSFSHSAPSIPSAQDKQREAQERERKRQDGKIVLAGNKYARAATVQRREHEKKLLNVLWGRKSPVKPPAGLLAWAVKVVISEPEIITELSAVSMAAELLGLKTSEISKGSELLKSLNDAHASVMLIALAIGSVEARMQRPVSPLDPKKLPKPDYWRVLHTQTKSWASTLDQESWPRELLGHLRAIAIPAKKLKSYNLTPLERALLGEMTLTAALDAEKKAELATDGTLTTPATPTNAAPATKAPAKAAKKAPVKPAKAIAAKATASTTLAVAPAPEAAAPAEGITATAEPGQVHPIRPVPPAEPGDPDQAAPHAA